MLSSWQRFAAKTLCGGHRGLPSPRCSGRFSRSPNILHPKTIRTMITLPDVRPKSMRRTHSGHPKFFPGLEFTSEGLQLIKIPEFEFDQCIRKVSYSSNYHAAIFESSQDYFVVGEKDSSTFRIIFRREDGCSDSSSTSGSLGPLSPSGPSARDDVLRAERAVEGTADPPRTEPQAARQKHKQVIICIPEFVLKVCIHYDQIFFRSENRIFIYTPAATSGIEVRSLDIYINHFLYILTRDRILVYGESLLEEIEFEVLNASGKRSRKHAGAGLASLTSSKEQAVSKILVLDCAIFLIKFNVLYKIVSNQCVFSYDCIRPVISARADSSRIYLHTNGYVFSIHALDNTVKSVYTGVSSGALHLSESFLLLHNGRNGTLFLMPDTLVCIHSELLDTEYTAVSCCGKCISYAGHSHILTHTNQRLAEHGGETEPGGRRQRALYWESGTFESIMEVMGRPEEKDLDQELQDIMDNKAEECAANKDPEEDGAVQKNGQEKLLMKFRHLDGDNTDPDSSTGSFYYGAATDEVGLGDLDADLDASSCSDDGEVAQGKYGCAARGSNARSITGKTNPATPNIRAYAVCDGNVVRTYFRDRECPYRRSEFFIASHMEWFKREFQERKEEAELPISTGVYDFIESKAGGRPPAVGVARRTQPVSSATAQRKRKTGGF